MHFVVTTPFSRSSAPHASHARRADLHRRQRTHEEVSELYGLRELLEPDLMVRGVLRLTRDDIALAEQIRLECAEAVRVGEIEAWCSLTTELLLALYRAAERPQSLALVNELLVATEPYMSSHFAKAKGAVTSIERKHSELLAASRVGDGHGAAAIIYSYIPAIGRQVARTANVACQTTKSS